MVALFIQLAAQVEQVIQVVLVELLFIIHQLLHQVQMQLLDLVAVAGAVHPVKMMDLKYQLVAKERLVVLYSDSLVHMATQLLM